MLKQIVIASIKIADIPKCKFITFYPNAHCAKQLKVLLLDAVYKCTLSKLNFDESYERIGWKMFLSAYQTCRIKETPCILSSLVEDNRGKSLCKIEGNVYKNFIRM